MSSLKHLSTHVYFHMERPAPKKSVNPPTGFGQQHTSLDNATAATGGIGGGGGGGGRGTGGRPQNLRSRSKEHGPHTSTSGISGNAFERLNRSLRSGLDPFQDGLGYDSANDDGSRFEPVDYFTENPYLLSPDFAARDRGGVNRRKAPWKKSREKYDLTPSDHELQDFGVYGNRFGGEPSFGRSPEDRLIDPGDTGGSSSGSGGGSGHRGDAGNRRMPRSAYEYQQQQQQQQPEPLNQIGQEHVQGKPGQDYFIVPPSNKVDKFLPAKMETNAQALNLLGVNDPKMCVIIDFGENATFASQDLPSPPTSGLLSLAPKEWTTSQLCHQRKLFTWLRDTRVSSEGMLLMNVERHCQFPFVTYLVMNSDPRRLITELEIQVDCGPTHEDHHIAGYEEVATIAKLPDEETLQTKIISSIKTGYIISAFRVFPGEDSEKLERSWLTWTGARQIYKRLPQHLGLRRIAFHKKVYPDIGITYVLICECTTLMEFVTEACCFVDQLRARCCGYTALYRVADYF